MAIRNFPRRLMPAFALALIAGLSVPAQAGLYPPAAPPGSAFVRVFNGSGQSGVNAQIGDKSVPAVPAMAASSYVFLAPGEYPAKVGGSTQALQLDGGRCYTAALQGNTVTPFEQDCFDNPLKALISVFNLVDGSTLSVKASAGGPAIVDAVDGGTSGHREVNPTKATLAVYNGEAKLAEAKPITLERGKVYSLFITGSSDKPTLTWVVN
jgi:alginate O-acetyltransferase complex protein AlgF